MLAALIAAFATGDFGAEGATLTELAWGRMTLIDLYVGALLVGAWIGHRETSWPARIAWWIGLVALGHLASAVYVLVASRAKSWTEFWSGAGQEP